MLRSAPQNFFIFFLFSWKKREKNVHEKSSIECWAKKENKKIIKEHQILLFNLKQIVFYTYQLKPELKREIEKHVSVNMRVCFWNQ